MKTLAKLGMVVALIATPAMAYAESYGAISYSPSTGSFGWSHDYTTEKDAEDSAQNACLDRADDCQVAVWYRDACGAVAAGTKAWRADWGQNMRQARRKALKQCDSVSGNSNCQIVQSQCSPEQ